VLAILSIAALVSAKPSVAGRSSGCPAIVVVVSQRIFRGDERGDIVRGGLAWTEVSDGERGGLGGGRIRERSVLPVTEGIDVRRVLGTGMPDLRKRSGDVARDIVVRAENSSSWTVKAKSDGSQEWEMGRSVWVLL